MKLGVAWTVDRDGSIHCMLHIPRRTRVGRSPWSRDSKWRPPSIPKNGRMPQAKSGAQGGEAHFAALHRTWTDEIRTAIVIRKDGREIGRERVSDLRGALHPYGPASAGWLVTTGQVLSHT